MRSLSQNCCTFTDVFTNVDQTYITVHIYDTKKQIAVIYSFAKFLFMQILFYVKSHCMEKNKIR